MDKNKRNRRFFAAALFVCMAIAFFLSPFASSNPDGLEKAAERLGFLNLGEVPVWGRSLMPDYAVPFLGETTLSGMVAGLVGTMLLFGLGWGVGVILRKRKRGT